MTIRKPITEKSRHISHGGTEETWQAKVNWRKTLAECDQTIQQISEAIQKRSYLND